MKKRCAVSINALLASLSDQLLIKLLYTFVKIISSFICKLLAIYSEPGSAIES
jgi:hypothetical protein